MLSKILSACIVGIDACPVDVEVDISARGLPHFSIVGLPDTSVKESKDRVRAALRNIGFHFPLKQVTVNLAPADLKKEGSAFDLPIAVGVMAAEEVLAAACVQDYVFLGELSLDGRLKPVRGALSVAMMARKMGARGLILPEENAAEAAVVDGVSIYPMKELAGLVDFLRDGDGSEPFRTDIYHMMKDFSHYEEDFAEVKGQELAKRALQVAAAGSHNILMMGPPGAGKTMLAKRLATIMPEMTFDEAVETTQVHSVAGILKGPFLAARPFRAPHHTISDIALIGGGQVPRPGEVSLAHNGVLFLDELPEFKRGALEVLRQPIENGEVTVSRAVASITYPASFMLVAAMNPCPCGYHGDGRHECVCTAGQIYRYKNRISGPLMDRIDIHIDVPAVAYRDLSGDDPGESSATMRNRVIAARGVQLDRFKNDRKVFANSRMKTRHLKKYCALTDEAHSLLEAAMQKLGLSARAYSRVLKVARTIADLEASADIRTEHVAEAIQYRSMYRAAW